MAVAEYELVTDLGLPEVDIYSESDLLKAIVASLPSRIADSGLSQREKVGYLADSLKNLPQVDCPVTHSFAPGVYLREIFMPAGTVMIGKIHKTEHFNLLDRGVCSIIHDDGTHEFLRAPLTFVSKAGVQKVLYIHEDTVWRTIHVTPETDLVKLEALLIEPQPTLALESPTELLK